MQKTSLFPFLQPVIHNGGVGVIPTDTIYGIVGSATNKNAVEKIYRLRKRNPKKPMIILIGSIADLKKFGITISPATRKMLNKVWPGKVSVILKISSRATLRKFKYLHRGTGTLAFRLPAAAAGRRKGFDLRRLLQKTGPLVAPSANFEGEPPARTIKEAKYYFGDKVAFYIDVGRLVSKPSTLIQITQGKMQVIRQGARSI
jgi:L-threonylcarbamoyladenylate synthase